MKTALLSTFAFLLLATGNAQIPILYYDFENNTTRTTFENAAEQSVNTGSSSLVRWFSGGSPNTSTPSGAGLFNGGSSAGTAFASNRWPSADPGTAAEAYFGFNTNTAGFNGLTISFDALTNQAGMTVAVAWGTNNSTFTASATGGLSLSTGYANYQFTLPAAAENQTIIYVKIYAYNSTSQNGSTITIDNVTLNATTVNASKTLLNYASLGLSLTSGTAYNPPYENLTITGSGTTATLGGNLRLQGTLSLNAGILAVGTSTLMMNGSIVQGSGLINTANGTMSYGGSATQNLNPAHFTGAINNLTITNNAGVTAASNITVSNSLSLSAGTLSLGTTTINIGGSVFRTNGLLNASSGTVQFNGTAAQTIAAGIFSGNVLNLTINNAAGVSTSADAIITGTLALSAGTYNITNSVHTIVGTISQGIGIINATNGTMSYGSSVAQDVNPAHFSGAISNLTISNSAGVNAGGNLTVSNSLALTAGTFLIGITTLSIGGSVTRTTGLLNASSGTVQFNGTAAQTIAAGIFSGNVLNLTINNAAGVSTSADATIMGNLSLTNGTYNINNSTQTIQGNINRTTGLLNASSGTVQFNGTAAQTIAAGIFSGNVLNLTINNAAGVSTSADAIITGTLALSAGTYNITNSVHTIRGLISAGATGKMNATLGTVSFNGNVAQSVSPTHFTGAINNLTINNSNGVSAGGNLTISSVLSLAAGTFSLGSTTLSIQGAVTRVTGVMNAAAGTVQFTGLISQSVAAGIFTGSVNHMTVNNAAGVITAADLEITGTLGLVTGTYDITTSTQTISGTMVVGSGLMNATSGTVVFKGAVSQTIAQTVFTGTIRNLTINNTGGVAAGGNLTISNQLTLTAGIFSVGTTVLTVGGNIVRSTGLIDVVTGSIVYSGTGAQSISAGIFSGTIKNLTINNGAGVNSSADATITGIVTLTAGTYNIGTSTQTITGNLARTSGTMDAAAGTIVFNGSTAQVIGAGSFSGSLKNLTINNAAGVSTAANTTVTGSLALVSGTYLINASTQTITGTISVTTGTIDASVGTVIFNGSAAQTIPAGLFLGNVMNLAVNNTAGVTAGSGITIKGLLTLNAGTLNIGTTVLTLSGSVTRISGTVNATTGTVVFDGSAAQTVAASWFTGALSSLVFNNGSGVTATGNLTVSSVLSLTAGTFSLSNTTLTTKGSITRTTGVIDATSGTIVFNGTTAQTISAGVFTGSVMTLVINNNAGVSTSADLTITGTLTLSGGTYYIGTSTHTILGNISATVGTIDASSGALVLSGSAPQNITSGVYSGNIHSLTINNTSGVTTNANTTITGTLNLTAGTYSIGSSTQTITGSIIRTSGVLDASSGTIILNGNAAQLIPTGSIATNIRSLTVNNQYGVTINDHHTILSSLVLQAGTLGLNGKTVTIGGTVTGAGTFKGSSSSGLTVASTIAAGTLNFDQTADGATNALGTFAITSGSAALGSKLQVYVALNIAGGTLDLAAKNLVLKSNESATAYVAEIKGTLTGETNVSVERYNPAWSSRRWRLLTSPVLNTTINNAWQEGSKWNGSSPQAATGYGTLISGNAQGSATTANTNGFDFWSAIAGTSASIRTYAPGTTFNQAVWNGVSSTLTPGAFDQNQAYLLFIRGDRSFSAGSSPGSTTLRPNGTLKKGSFTINVPVTQSHTLIGNPYASPLDFKKVYDANSSKIQPSFWVWQSSLGTGSGGYVLIRPVAAGSSLYEAIPGDGSQSAANRLIHSGEGFFVMPVNTVTGTNNITIQEAHKSTGNPAVAVFRQMNNGPAKLYVNLFTGTSATKTLLDGALAEFDPVSATTSMGKSTNNMENLSIQENGKDLILRSGTLPGANDTLKLRLWNTAVKNYELAIRGANFAGLGLTAFLVDKYQKTETALSLSEATTSYSFGITADALSKDPARFSIVFRPAVTLPLFICSLQAEEKEKSILVEWKVADETGIKAYQLEKSQDGKDFSGGREIAARNAQGEQRYQQIDNQPASVIYYRVKMLGVAGEIKYSPVIKLQPQKAGSHVLIYPNPVLGKTVHLQLRNKTAGNYTITIFNMLGQPVTKKLLRYSGGIVVESIVLGDDMTAGNYLVEIRGENGSNEFLNISLAR